MNYKSALITQETKLWLIMCEKISSGQIWFEEQVLDKEFGYDNRGVVFHSFHSHRII